MTGTMLDIKEMRHELMATYFNVTIALQIRQMRLARGWSQYDLAKELGTGQAVVSKLEQIRWDHWPHVNTLQDVARVFDVGLMIRFRSWGDQIAEFLGSPGECADGTFTALSVENWEAEYQKLAEEFGA